MHRSSRALPSHCSNSTISGGVDTDLVRVGGVAIGTFRCPATWPSFRDTGPISECLIAFPRTGVWICHQGSRRFLADPTIITMYNRGQRYERFVASPDGDRCDWFAIDEAIAREIVSAFDERAGESERPFRFEWAPSSMSLYLKQRAVVRRASRGALDRLGSQEAVIHIVAAAIALAYARRAEPRVRRPDARTRRREIVEATRAALLSTVRENTSVHTLAAIVGTSPYHLCRVFRASTGRTLLEYRNELRVRIALELLERRTAEAATLSAIAHDLGFSSHAHFVLAMRRSAAATPSAIRALVG